MSCVAGAGEAHCLMQGSGGGSDNPDNLVFLCKKRHRLVTLSRLRPAAAPGREFKGAAFINAAMGYIVSGVKKLIPQVVTQEG